VGAGSGPYGELEGWLEWPAELYADERKHISFIVLMEGKQAHITDEIKSIYTQEEQARSKGNRNYVDFANVDTTNRLIESLKSKVEKLKEDEWMYSSTDTLFKRDRQVK
jgi:hypothetical protein